MMPLTNMQRESSLCNWFPKVKDLLPVPRTEILPLTPEEVEQLVGLLDGEMPDKELVEMIKSGAAEIGYPLFLRSDQTAGKHDYKNTCYAPDERALLRNIVGLVEYHLCRDVVGLGFAALVFRELLPLRSSFKAFRGELPIAKERRYFVEEGKVLCHHPYWPEGAIERPSTQSWRERLAELNQECREEIASLTILAEIFSERVPGFWSVDFAETVEGRWYMIDAARGELSWHPEYPEESSP